MSAIEEKLKAMGLTLPPPRKFPSPNRRGCVRVGNIIFVSDHGAHHPDMKWREAGKLGADMTVEEGKMAARIAALAILSTVKQEIATKTTDIPIRTVDAGGHHIGVAVVHGKGSRSQ